jgi:hypothetical protein
VNKTHLAITVAAGIVFLCVATSGTGESQDPSIRLRQKNKGDPHGAFDVVGLDATALAKLAKAGLNQDQWAGLFAVFVKKQKGDSGNRTAMLGAYEIKAGVLRFQPRFPLVRGLRYQAVFDPKRWPGGGTGPKSRLVADFTIPAPARGKATVVNHVYPTRNQLPENQLKFYISFSAAMSQGDVYRHITLLNAAGKPIEQPFLELREELWDPEGKRFTLLFDPGRIKKGLQPREELGPVLENGKTYTLVIDRHWEDAEGNPLKESYRKVFRAGPAEDGRVDPQSWKLVAPPAGTKDPLTVKFSRPLDYALLQRALWLIDAHGRKVSGQATVSAEETRWQFTPAHTWAVGSYDLVVDASLEDLAGNNVIRPFEVDVFRPIQRKIQTKIVKVPFQVKDSG